MYNQRQLLPGRIPELLETFKSEFETLAHDVNVYKIQKDDYERKFQTQLTELNTIQTALFELERTHSKIKQQYEEEIIRLRRQLEAQGHQESIRPNALESEKSALPGQSSSGLFYPSPSGLQNSAEKRRFPSSSNSPLSSPSGPPIPSPLPKRPRPDDLPPNASVYPQHSQGQHSQSPFLSLVPFSSLSNGTQGNSSSALHGANPTNNNSNNSAPIIVDLDRPVKQGKPEGGGNAQNLPSIMERSGKEHLPFSPNQTSPLPTSSSSSSGSATTPSSQPGSASVGRASPPQNPLPETKKPSHNESSHSEDGQTNSKNENSTKKNEWIVGHNPSVPTVLNVDLAHTFDHSSVVCCVRFSHDGKYLASGCNRSTQIYDVGTGEKISVLSDDNAKDGDLYIRSVCFSPDGTLLAAGAEDKTVKLWDLEKKRITHTFVGHELDIYSLDWSHDGRLIVSGSGDKKTKIWDREKGKCLLTLGNDEVGPKDGVTSIAMSPDGRLVAVGSLDRIIRLWDVQTGYFLDRFEGHSDSVYSVAFSPDGKSLVSGSLDKTLKLWDLSGSRSRSRCRSTFTGHKDFVLSVAFSADGNWLVSGSKDRTVQFWDPRNGVTYMMLQGHKNSVISVAMSPAGGMFATGSGDFLARLWRYEPR